MTRIKDLRAIVLALSLGLPWALPAMADGEFFQLDYAPGASSVSASVVRGPFGFGLGWSDFEFGSAVSANATYGVRVPVLGDGAIIRFGPSLRFDEEDQFDLGVKAVFERWSPTSWGSVFVLTDFNTIQNEYLLLGELSHAASGLSASLAMQGGDANFQENTLVVGYGIPQSRVRLRLGYRFDAQQVLVGFSVNTF